MYTRTKMSHPPTHLQVLIDRLRFVLGVVAIIAIAVTFVLNNQADVAQNERITKVESPCLRYGSESRQCHESFQAAIDSITDYQLCALLAKRPELTNVSAADCRKIAREQHRRGTDVIGQSDSQSVPGSPAGKSPAPAGSTPPAGNNEHPAPGGQTSPGSGHHQGTEGGGQTPSSPESPGSPSSPGQGAPSSPDSPASQSGGSANQPSPVAPESQPLKPPSLVEVETPGLPVQACVPGVLSVNCPR